MRTFYVDASAWCKLLVEEPETAAFTAFVDSSSASGDAFVSSALLMSEVLRMTAHFGVDRVVTMAGLGQVSLFVPGIEIFRQAGMLEGPTLRTLDAIHVAACLAIGADVFVSYDARQIEAANAAGIATVSPGA